MTSGDPKLDGAGGSAAAQPGGGGPETDAPGAQTPDAPGAQAPGAPGAQAPGAPGAQAPGPAEIPPELVEFWGTATKEVRDRLVAEALEGEPPDQTSGAGRKLLIAAAVVGLVVAVWALGRPPAAEDEAPTSTAATATTVTEDSSADYAARAAELEAVLAAEPSNTDAMLELGVAYFNTGQIERAAAQWNKVAELAPDSAAAWFNLGFYHLSSDPPDAELAKAAWEKVIELAPGSDSALTAAKHLEALNASLEASATPSAAAQDP